MTAHADFGEAFARCPLVAILRGVRPAEVEGVADVLIEIGFTLIEVPLNSPDPLVSILRLVKRHGNRAMIGAGTVLREAEVAEIASIGGRLVLSPNTDRAVIAATVAEGLVSLPGCMTPTEAFAAIDAGAHALKFFPAEAMVPAALKAMGAVLPPDVPRLVVGGITPENMAQWRSAGVTGFGLGSALYRAGDDPAMVRSRAGEFFHAFETLRMRGV
jgi:2-dehydro-3-deoxyphosphogalactonate aldolase